MRFLSKIFRDKDKCITIGFSRIGFGRIARTITYEDPQGSLVFTFDLGSLQPDEKGVWTIVLEGALIVEPRGLFRREKLLLPDKTSPQQASWIRTARLHVLEYLRSIPCNVIDSEATEVA